MKEPFLRQVICDDALRLRALLTASIDAIVIDPLYGTNQGVLHDLVADPMTGTQTNIKSESPLDDMDQINQRKY